MDVIEKLVLERNDLFEKQRNLRNFLAHADNSNFASEMFEDLCLQDKIMESYIGILNIRIRKLQEEN